MNARDLMTPEPIFSIPADPIEGAAREMRDLDVGIIPVVSSPEDPRLKGVITDRDITVRHVAEECSGCTVEDHMTVENVATVSPGADVEEIELRMMDRKVRRIPVVDEDGTLLGIVAQADLARRLGDQESEKVEEVVEEISR